jgi:3-methyladenine DNA glycosylase/8-oxoguanine DNA glycosylase
VTSATVDQRVRPPDTTTVWRPSFPVDMYLTLGTLAHGRYDPCHRVTADGALWRTTRLRSGPVTVRMEQRSRHEIAAQAWGAGADELMGSLPTLLGANDDPDDFDPRHEVLRRARDRLVGLRIPRTGTVLDSLVPAVLEQKVIGLDAFAAWQRLVGRFGEQPPGPAPDGMRLAPTAEVWRAIQSWDWHQAGVEERRARTARVCAMNAAKFQSAVSSGVEPAKLYRMLTVLPGVGRWTAAEVGHRVLGDADAVPIGDYHLGETIGWALTGSVLPDDEVEAFLEPWRPHRYRVFRLLELTPGARPPRRAPRMTRRDFRRY